jgi:putative addiction module CopG family antidote
MSVTLTPQTEAEIERLVETGRYPNADAAVQSALKLLNEQYEEKLAKLRELVLAGFNSGEAVELTEELWDEMERSSEERFQRGEVPPPHVCP